jgi:hypothetical protein
MENKLFIHLVIRLIFPCFNMSIGNTGLSLAQIERFEDASLFATNLFSVFFRTGKRGAESESLPTAVACCFATCAAFYMRESICK